MKMYPAYQKAAALAREHGRAVVVTTDQSPGRDVDHWDAVTVEEFSTPRHKRPAATEFYFFDLLEAAS